MKKMNRIASATAIGALALGMWAGPASALDLGGEGSQSTDSTTNVNPETSVDAGDVLSNNETGILNGDILNGTEAGNGNANGNGNGNSADAGTGVEAGNDNVVTGVLDSIL